MCVYIYPYNYKVVTPNVTFVDSLTHLTIIITIAITTINPLVNLVLFTNFAILNWGTTLYEWANPRGLLKHGDATSYFTVVNAIVILCLY